MTKQSPVFFVFDVESIGLHGEGFAVGYVVIDTHKDEVREIDSGLFAAPEAEACGNAADREWVRANVVPALETHVSKKRGTTIVDRVAVVHDMFWDSWSYWQGQGALACAECPCPVEARFLSDGIALDRTRKSPYPLIDIASVRYAAGFDSLETCSREPDELPAHNPLADARQSARLLIEALRKAKQL